jgi:hypothetical protein
MTATATYVQGTSYTFTITATNANGTSSTSSASSAVTPFPIPTIGSWSVGTSFPLANNLYGEARSLGANEAIVAGGGDFDSGQSGYSYTYNGSTWTFRGSYNGVLFPNLAGAKFTNTAQSNGGYYIQGGNANAWNTTLAFNNGWSNTSQSIQNCFVGSSIAWPSDLWSVTQGNSGNQTFVRTGTGSWSNGVNAISTGAARGHYAYGLGFTFFGNGGMRSQTSAGGAYTTATNPTGAANASWVRFNVANDALFYVDSSINIDFYRYNSNQTSTVMTSPVLSGWLNGMMASAGSQIFLVGGRLNSANTTTNYVATVS